MSREGSRIPGFYRLSVAQRRALIGLEGEGGKALSGGLELDEADGMIENVVGTYSLPLGVALNFRINDRDYLVPMVIEEPSVVAAASNAARRVRSQGGFHAVADPPVMTGQVQLTDVADTDGARARILAAKDEVLDLARAATPRLCERGGGPKELSVRVLEAGMLVVHVDIDCRDAMGANVVNGVCEALADRLAALAGGRVGLRILTNLAEHRRVRVTARLAPDALTCEHFAGGAEVRDAIAAASRFAELDAYRAATHNKGIMNGVDAVLLATGNDWRGVEAGAHAYAARGGSYAPLATWKVDGEGHLVGELDMPMAVGTIGGALRVHAGARLALALLAVDNARELACVVGAAGLAANLAALRALATEGIQRGHMSLHARVVARAVGATGEVLERVAEELAALGDVKPERARDILERVRRLPPCDQPFDLEVPK